MKFQKGMGPAAALAALTAGTQAGAEKKANTQKKADALIKQVTQKYKSIKTLSGSMTTLMVDKKGGLYTNESVELQRSNKARLVETSALELRPAGKSRRDQTQMRISDGKTLWMGGSAAGDLKPYPVDSGGAAVIMTSVLLALFFHPEDLGGQVSAGFLTDAGMKPDIRRTYGGTAIVDGIKHQIIRVEMRISAAPGAKPFTRTTTFYIRPDKLIDCITVSAQSPLEADASEGLLTVTERFTRIKVNKTIPDADFVYTPPTGAKREK